MIVKYFLTKDEKEKTRRFARRYPFWVQQISLYRHTMKSQKMNDVITKNHVPGKPTESLALKNAKAMKYIRLVEETAVEADPFYWKYILRGVTEKPYNVTYEKLVQAGLACGRNTYYDRRRRFYWLLSKKLKMIRYKDADNGCGETIKQEKQRGSDSGIENAENAVQKKG